MKFRVDYNAYSYDFYVISCQFSISQEKRCFLQIRYQTPHPSTAASPNSLMMNHEICTRKDLMVPTRKKNTNLVTSSKKFPKGSEVMFRLCNLRYKWKKGKIIKYYRNV